MTLDLLIDQFERGGPLLSYAISGLSREQEAARPGPGAWSIAELAVHMLDSDLVAADRIKRVIAEDSPTLLAYDENAWLARLRYETLPVEEAVSMFVANRRWIARILRALPEADFARAGTHSEKGRVTLADLVRTYVGHLDHHLAFLYAKRGNLGVAIYPRYSDPSEKPPDPRPIGTPARLRPERPGPLRVQVLPSALRPPPSALRPPPSDFCPLTSDFCPLPSALCPLPSAFRLPPL